MKNITPDPNVGLGLSNLHIQDGGLSTEDDLGKDILKFRNRDF